MLTKSNKIMLITSSHEIPYPSPYMGYVGMWVDLGDGPKESMYKLRGRKELGRPREWSETKTTDASWNPRWQDRHRKPER